jgi:putative membrane protein
MKIILNLLLSAVAVMVAAYIIPGVNIDSFAIAVILAVVLGLVNTFIKPVLTILTFPVTFLTLGLFSLVINGGLILLADNLVDGFFVPGFFTAVIFSIVLSLINSLLLNTK